MGKILVTAGEVSGDLHAARVVYYIKKMVPGTEIAGMGSKKLRQAGADILIDPTEINSIGFQEAASNFRTHLDHYKFLKKYVKKEKPDVMFLVDYSGFNMMMARLGKKENIPVVNYFAPTAWIWGRWRARWMARMGATIAAVFPMEIDVYRRAGAEVKFVGHPLLDIVQPSSEKKGLYEYLEVNPDHNLVALLPGSRTAEVDKLLDPMLKAAVRLKKDNDNLEFIIPLADNIAREPIVRQVSEYNLIAKVVKNRTREAVQISDFIVTASGTATLEAAILNTPMLIIYKTSALTYTLGKRLLKQKMIGLPNLISSQEIVPELVQKDVTPENIFRKTNYYLRQPYLLQEMKRNLKQVASMLGKEGAIARTANLVIKKGALSSD
ncbi:MAG: lipid-A-disaccharide synthase [Halanaerobiaceae bacterium]